VVSNYLRGLPTSDRITDLVRACVGPRLGIDEPSPSTVAAELAMSSRTLSRRLHDEGTTFRTLVEDLRMETARQLLAAGGGTEVVARRIGFSDATAFRRAFKRRTGVTPADYRASVGRAGAGPPPAAGSG
jgi:AraC-like DNA-binding protein